MAISVDDRTRAWAFIFYPDDPNLVSNYLEVINSWHCDCVLSPLHSPDSKPLPDESDSLVNLKRHHHCVLLFDGKKSQKQIISLISSLGSAVTKPFPLHSITGYIRYLIHADDPSKEQFSGIDDIVCFGSSRSKVVEAFEIGFFDLAKITQDMNKWILDNHISEFVDLYHYALIDQPKWCYALDKFPCRSVHANLSSIRWGSKHA